MGKLLAIDALHIIRRVYEASQEPDTLDKAELALRHSLASFRRLLATHAPTHVLAAFEHGRDSWRRELYPAYRQNRAPMPEVLQHRLPDFHQALESAGIAVVAVPQAEADDIIGTAVLRWLEQGRGEAVVASTDKDVLWLLSHGARIWDHFRQEWHDATWVEEKFGVSPEKMPDLLALMGDSGNGIPGVPKVGIKAGAKLLNSYGDLDGVMAGAGILMDNLGERLRKERENVFLYRQLARLKTDFTLGVTWNRLAYRPPEASDGRD